MRANTITDAVELHYTVFVFEWEGLFGKPCISQTTELKDINEITELLS